MDKLKLLRTNQPASIIENLSFKRIEINPGQKLEDVIIRTQIANFPKDIFADKTNVLSREKNLS